MSRAVPLTLVGPLLAGCPTKVADTADTGPEGYTSSIGACERQVGDWPLESGLYVATTDAQTVNTCENAQGAGFHVNLGVDNHNSFQFGPL